MEQRDLYDINRNITGKTIYANEKTPENYYILVVVLILQNENNQFLIQKRSPQKDGLWAFTGGHPKTGETSLEGIYTEVKEELGITINEPKLFKKASGKDTICDLYYLKQNIDLSAIKLLDDEVDEVKYATSAEIEELYNKGEFKKGHYKMYKDFLEFIGGQNGNNN